MLRRNFFITIFFSLKQDNSYQVHLFFLIDTVLEFLFREPDGHRGDPDGAGHGGGAGTALRQSRGLRQPLQHGDLAAGPQPGGQGASHGKNYSFKSLFYVHKSKWGLQKSTVLASLGRLRKGITLKYEFEKIIM